MTLLMISYSKCVLCWIDLPALSAECQPSKFISIDEGMVKYKGRPGFQQYLLMKPMKWGIKVWVRANAINGFVSTMQVYMGKKDASQPEHSLGRYVVCNLLSDLKGKKLSHLLP